MPSDRDVLTVAAELADVERHLRESPPHSSGDRAALEQRRRALQRELAGLRRARERG